MKHTFKSFLEGVATPSHTFKRATLDTEAAVKYITEQCTEWIKFIRRNKVVPLYRGDNNNDDIVSFGNSNNFYRSAANTTSWYSKWIDSSPEWEGYPKRLQSYICSSDTDYASGYGDLNIVVPNDSCKIAACPTMDIFNSFRHTSAFLDDDTDIDVAEFQDGVRGLFAVMGKYGPASSSSAESIRTAFEEITTDGLVARLKKMDDTISLLINKTEIPDKFRGAFSVDKHPAIDGNSWRTTLALREINLDVQRDYFGHFSHGEFSHPISDLFRAYSNCKYIVRAMIKNNIKDLAEVYDRKFRPKENGFELIRKLSAWNWKPDRELWVQGGCYFINLENGAGSSFFKLFEERMGMRIDQFGSVTLTKDIK
jgi:hypothetical protein